jgi:hypothetical protein
MQKSGVKNLVAITPLHHGFLFVVASLCATMRTMGDGEWYCEGLAPAIPKLGS